MGWQDDPIIAPSPAAAPAPVAKQPWENDPVIFQNGPRAADGVFEHMKAGLQSSVAGLALRGKLPDVQVDPSHSKWYESLATGAAQMVADLPVMIAGGVVGGVAGGAAGSAVPVLGTAAGGAVGGGAGAFALPAAIRESYIQAYQKGEITSTADFLDRAKIVLGATGKEALIGALTGGAGRAATVAAGAAGLGAKATGAAVLGAEGTTLTVAPAALEGHLPEPQDFVNTAVMLLGLKGATHGAAKLAEIYKRTGKTPMEVAADAKADPTIIDDLAKGGPTTPEVVAPVAEAPKALTPTEYQDVPLVKKSGMNAADVAATTAAMPPVPEGFVRMYRAESPTVKFEDVFDKDQLKEFASGKPGVRLTDDLKYADYFRSSYGQDATLRYVDVPKGVAEAGRINGYEYRIDLNKSVEPKAEPAKADPMAEYGPEIPRAYQELARKENAKNAVPEPSPEAAKFMEKPFAEIPQGKGEPVLDTHVNYNYLNTTDDVTGALSRLSELYESKIKESTRGTVSNEQTYAEARALYEQTTGQKAPEAALANADYAKLSADIYARKQLLISGAEQLMSMRTALKEATAGGTATPEMRLEFLAQVDRVAQAQAAVRGSQAEVGRALQILKSTNRDKDYYLKLNEVLNGRFGEKGDNVGAKQFDTMLDMLGDMGTPAQALKFAEQAAKATTWQKLVEGWKAGLVSGPFTQVANILGNVTFEATRPLVDVVAVAVNRATGSAERMSAAEPLARVIGNIQGTVDGARAAWSSILSGENSAKVDQHRKAIEGPAGEIIRTPFKMLSAMDAFFRVSNERGEAFALASRQASAEGYNPATREFRTRVMEITQNPTDKMQAQIEAAGQRFTFNTPLGEAGQSVQSVIRQLHLEWAIPFVQTPANVAKEMLRLTPGAPIIGEWRAAISEGGVARDKAVAEMAVGTAVATTMFSFALSGNISGSGDPDPRKRATQMAAGWQPYSVKIGDTWYSYQRLQPVGTLIGMAADMADAWEHMTPDESDKIPKILSTAFANAITNQTFLQGVTNIVNALADPSRFGPKFVQGLAGSVVPGIVAQPAQMMDPYKREVDSVLDAIKNRLPGVSETLRPKRDPYGEPIKANDRLGEISPITQMTASTDKVRTEAARLGIGVSKAPDHIELPAARDSKLGKVKLTSDQRDIFAKESGQLAYRVLDQLVNNPTWDNLPDIAQRNAINMVFEKTKLAGKAAAVPPEQIQAEATRIADELRKRLQPK